MNKILSVFAALVTITTLMVNLETITSWLTPEVPKNTTPVPHTANPNIPSDATDERDQNRTTKSSTPKVSKPKPQLPKSKPIKHALSQSSLNHLNRNHFNQNQN